MKRGNLRGTIGTSLSSEYGSFEYGGILRLPRLGSRFVLNLEGPPPSWEGLWVLDLVGDPRASRLRGLAESRPPARGWEEAPQPLGGSVAAATSSPALRFQTPAWSGHWLRLQLALRLVLGPQPRRPPGLRSIAASRLRPPARAHLPDCLAAPPSGPRAAARPFVRPAWRAPLRTRTSPSARSLSPRPRPRGALLPAALSRRAPRGADSPRVDGAARGAPTQPSGRAGSWSQWSLSLYLPTPGLF